MVREKLSNAQRASLSILIVISVHAKDIIESLYKLGVQSVDSFDWISQMRYYFNLDQSESSYETVGASSNLTSE